MKYLSTTICYSLILLFVISCKKDSTTSSTSSISVTISNSVGDNGTFSFTPQTVKYSNGSFSFYGTSAVNSGGGCGGSLSLSFGFKGKTPGTYIINGSTGSSGFCSNASVYYATDSANTGTVNVTALDTVNHIASGTFNFKADEQQPFYHNGAATLSNGSFSNVKW